MNWYKQEQQQMNILFLDDDENRIREFQPRFPGAIITRTAKETIAKLPVMDWDVVLLDHDLGGEQFVDSGKEDTGAGVARWVAENRPSVGRFIVHSHNPGGAKNMEGLLQQAGYSVECIPFATLIDQL
jgi:hypothetical protein